MITSLGTCRLVIPRSESTIASAGPSSGYGISVPFGSAASPSFGFHPGASSLGKNARTTLPKMIGSETFIIVAFRCTENSTSCCLASAICSARNESSAARRITAASRTSPASTATGSRSCVGSPPSAGANSIRTSPSDATVTDCSVERKSPSLIVDTCDFDSGDHSPIECGCLRAYSLTDAGARRSELPCRSTGLTALPLTPSYRARISRCSSSAGSPG